MSYTLIITNLAGAELTRRISGGDERMNHDERQRGAVRCIRWFAGVGLGPKEYLP